MLSIGHISQQKGSDNYTLSVALSGLCALGIWSINEPMRGKLTPSFNEKYGSGATRGECILLIFLLLAIHVTGPTNEYINVSQSLFVVPEYQCYSLNNHLTPTSNLLPFITIFSFSLPSPSLDPGNHQSVHR